MGCRCLRSWSGASNGWRAFDKPERRSRPAEVSAECNDKEQLQPMLEKLGNLPEEWGQPEATAAGKQCYGLRKHTVEPVFGIIKSVMGFRQCLLRGQPKARAEWDLVTLAWNVKRMFVLKAV